MVFAYSSLVDHQIEGVLPVHQVSIVTGHKDDVLQEFSLFSEYCIIDRGSRGTCLSAVCVYVRVHVYDWIF